VRYVFEPAHVLGQRADDGVALAAAAVECAVGAIDVADDLIDHEWHDAELTTEAAINASLALAFLGQCCIAQLAERIGIPRAHMVQTLLAAGALGSCGGQELDLLLESAADVNAERALQATIIKSGSLGAMACQVGAALATDDMLTLHLIGVFGRHLGTCAQLLNDLAGVDIEQAAAHKSDLRRRKKTVPVAYLLSCARRDGLNWVLDWYTSPPGSDPNQEPRVAALIHDLGGLQYTWVLADSYHREARVALEALVNHTQSSGLSRLRRLLPSVRARSRA
jgi:geranylgeranyl diphosphate synthase, type I